MGPRDGIEDDMSVPTKIDRMDDGDIVIRWDDETQTRWKAFELRQACPCATCREKKREVASVPSKPKLLPVISAAEARPVRIESMRPVGNYAYNINFSDGHGSGIFSFAMLKRESQPRGPAVAEAQ